MQAELACLPSDFLLVRVGPNKAPIAGNGWFDADNYSPDEAAALNGSSPPAWGLKSGPVSGVVVLDLDAEGWLGSFEQITGHPITDLPPTIGWTSGKTDRSGHAFQVDPDWWPYLANRRSWKNSNGQTCWELRGDRCQSVIIGAHPETGGYSWLPGRSPRDIPDPAPAPDWLLEALVVQELPNVPNVAPTAADGARAEAMLQCLPPEQFAAHDDWLRVGMALHHTDAGLLSAWVDWSRSMSSFDEAECLRRWASFGKGYKGRPATIGSLHLLAKEHGYKEPRRKRERKGKEQGSPSTTNSYSTAQWQRVFTELLKQPESLFSNQYQDCPLCSSTGDFKGQVMDPGFHMICNNCGGLDGKGGMVTEIGFASRILKLDRDATKARVAQFLGVALPRAKPEQPSPAPTASQQDRQPISMAEVSGRLRQELAEGATEAQIVELVAELSADADQHPLSIQKLAEAIRAEQRQAAEVRAEAVTLAAEADRQELGQILTAAFLLPPTIAAAIETRTRYLPCEGPSAVLPFLATVAGLVKLGTEVEGCAVAGYYVPINLFACLVGDSGAKKSPVGRLVVDAPTQALRDEMARCNQRQHEEWEQACRDQKRGEQRPPAPRPKQLKVSDYTGEALAAQLQTQEAAGLGLLINRDELSGLFGSLNQYRGGKGGDEQQLLELFDGGGLSSLRIVGDRHYSRSQVSIWGSTQPDVLRQLVADGDASGLWARFLFVPLPKRAVPLPLTTTPAEVAEVEAAAQTLANTCNAVYRLPRQTYRLDLAAAESFANYELNRQRAALGASIGAQSALYGKSAGKVLRVAGVLHLLQIATGEIDSRALIAADTIDRAAALVDHLDAWALGLHAEVAAGGVGGLMRTVHKAAEAAGAPIRWSELLQRLSKQQRKETDSAAAGEAMRALAAAGYGEVETGKRGALSYRATRALP